MGGTEYGPMCPLCKQRVASMETDWNEPIPTPLLRPCGHRARPWFEWAPTGPNGEIEEGGDRTDTKEQP